MDAEMTRLLTTVGEAVRATGARLVERFDVDSRPPAMDAFLDMVRASDQASLDVLGPALTAARPTARLLPQDDEFESGPLPDGEWWIVDPTEGAVNLLHGMPEWALTATLVRDNAPVLTAAYVPLAGELFTAAAGAGAYLNGSPLRVSAKTQLDAVIAGTSQARPDEDRDILEAMGASIVRMMDGAFVVRLSVPATLHLLNVAAGRMDAFWQHTAVRADVLPGALLVAEAGGIVTDLRGEPWTPDGHGFLAAAPGVHGAVLRTIQEAAPAPAA